MKNISGFTLLEIIITMALVIVVVGITGSAFNSIQKTSGRLVASEESNIEGVVGLEMFRHDIQQAGFGLAHAFSDPAPSYAEATVLPASKLNDGKGTSAAPTAGNVPRAIASWNDLTTNLSDATSETGVTYNVISGTDYLAIKATTVGTSTTARKWTYLTYSSGGKAAKSWPDAEDNLTASTDRVIMMNRTFTMTGGVTNTLVYDTSTPGTYWVNYTNSLFNSAFSPLSPQQVYCLYGIVKSKALAMPFNRADFFVARPTNTAKIPSSCAPGTGILYKTNVNHSDSSTTRGRMTYMPLLDCVADMQVVFGWDLNGNGIIEESSAYESDSTKISVSGPTITAAGIKTILESPDEIRNKLKYVKVYIMVQEGRKDSGFTNVSPINVGDVASLTKQYSVVNLSENGRDWLHYRWKIFRIVVHPNNLSIN